VGLRKIGVRRLLGIGDSLPEDLRLLERQQGVPPHVLRERRDIPVVDEVDPVQLAVGVGARQLA
jgi:hypothetical protein